MSHLSGFKFWRHFNSDTVCVKGELFRFVMRQRWRSEWNQYSVDKKSLQVYVRYSHIGIHLSIIVHVHKKLRKFICNMNDSSAGKSSCLERLRKTQAICQLPTGGQWTINWLTNHTINQLINDSVALSFRRTLLFPFIDPNWYTVITAAINLSEFFVL